MFVFGCQYQCNLLPGKTRLRYDLLCVEWDVKPYTLTLTMPESSRISVESGPIPLWSQSLFSHFPPLPSLLVSPSPLRWQVAVKSSYKVWVCVWWQPFWFFFWASVQTTLYEGTYWYSRGLRHMAVKLCDPLANTDHRL